MDHTHQEGSAIAVGGAAVTTCVLHPAGKALGLHLGAHFCPDRFGLEGVLSVVLRGNEFIRL